MTLVKAVISSNMIPKAQAIKAKINKWDYSNQEASAQQRKQKIEEIAHKRRESICKSSTR
jgi:hypothetical protein